jgi:hypothetical protein
MFSRLIEEAAVPVRVLDVDRSRGESVLFRLQVSAASMLGALALNCGGLLIDNGWLRAFGGGHGKLADLATVNGLGDPSPTSSPPAQITVAYDVLGGRFAINGGDLPGQPGEVAYWGPDTLDWTALGVGHSAFMRWALAGGTTDFYCQMRWLGWTDEVMALAPDQGVSIYPPLFSAEGRDVGKAHRRPVPMNELLAFHADAAEQIKDLPPNARVHIRVTE